MLSYCFDIPQRAIGKVTGAIFMNRTTNIEISKWDI